MFDSKLNSLLVLSVTKSLTRTAEIVNLTQPSITAQIRALESEYDIPIIKRIGNDLIITPEAKILIKHAEKIKSDYLGAECDIKKYKTNIRTLKVGVTSGVESTFISLVFAKLTDYYEQKGDKVNISIIYNEIDELIKRLRYYEMDFIISDDEANYADLSIIKLDSDNLACITAKNSDIAHCKKTTLDELKTRNLLIRLPNSSTQILFDAILRTNNLAIKDFKIFMELNSVSAIKNLVKSGVADAILANNACINEIKRGELVAIPIEGVTTQHNTTLVFRSDHAYEEIAEQIKTLYNETKLT